jgi:hypothetical protein
LSRQVGKQVRVNSLRPSRQRPNSGAHPLAGHERALLEEHLMKCAAAGMPPDVLRAHREMYGLLAPGHQGENLLQRSGGLAVRSAAPAASPAGWPPALAATIRALVQWARLPSADTSVCYDELLPESRREHRRSPGQINVPPAVAATPTVRILSEDDTRRWLHRLYYERSHRKGRNRIPLKLVAEIAGLNRDTLYEALKGGKISEVTRGKLSWVIRAIEDGRLKCIRRRNTWHVDAKDNPLPPIGVQSIDVPPGSTFGRRPPPPWRTE